MKLTDKYIMWAMNDPIGQGVNMLLTYTLISLVIFGSVALYASFN